MRKVIQRGLVFLLFLVPLISSRATTEVYGLIKVVVLELGVLFLLVLWLIRMMYSSGASPSSLVVSKLGWPILFFFGVAVLSLVRATNISEAVKSLYQLGAGIGLFFLIVNNVEEEREVKEIIVAIVLSGLIASLISLYENRGIKPGVLRFAYTSTFGNPIFFAQYLSLAMPLSIAMVFQKNSAGYIFSRLFFALSALVMLVLLFLTRSRGAFLGAAAAFIYGYIVLWIRSAKKIRKILIGMLITGLMVVILSSVLLPQLKGWAGENIRLRNLMRVYLWGSAFQMVKEHPILGVGIGNFKVIYPLYRSQEEKEVTPKGVKYTKAHNDFLEIWAETGALGLICFLLILFIPVSYILRPLQERAAPFTPLHPERGVTGFTYISLGLSAGLITLLVQAFFNPLLYIPASGMGFWMLLGLIAIDRGRYFKDVA